MHIRFLTILMSLFLLSGCMTQADKQQQADQLLHQLHQAIQTQQWDQAKKLFDAKFFKSQPETIWRQNIIDTQKSLGKMLSFNLASKSKDPRFSGDFYVYIIAIQHERGFSNETVTIFNSLDNDQLTIAGYLLTSRRNQ